MDTRIATNNYRIRQWMNLISARAGTGLTVRDYCKQAGITKHQYYYWQRKIRTNLIDAAASNPSASAEFAELTYTDVPAFPEIPSPSGSFSPSVEIRIGKMTIGIGRDVSRSLLETVVEVVSHVK